MAFVSVTRLRIRSWRFLPAFFLHATRSQRQVERSPGFLGGSLLPGRGWVFWTLTLWDDAASMRAYMTAGAHRAAMPKLMHWCDEASVTHWETETPVLPGWQEATERMRAEGRPSKVRHPSLDHQAMTYVAPRGFNGQPIRPRQP